MQRGADLTLKLGTVSALGAAVTGYAQWHDLQEMEEPRRIGTMHAMLNVAATGSYALSWFLRDTGHRRAGYLASTAGMSLASLSGLLGGDLAYRLGIGVSRDAFEDLPAEWTAVAIFADLPEGELVRLEDTSEPLMALRTGGDVRVAALHCTHVGAPLDEGELDGTCVTCPWHGSVFDLRDGAVLHGPATTPLATMETRFRDGLVEVRTGV
ncbi:MAG TPA: Rieske 2Fe-2S domain-containing protein, partial [Thermomicrobiales bacterium]|nr:Rieske 2Fe-2S domain-containing protein [Thermomicrobiales bacterium]